MKKLDEKEAEENDEMMSNVTPEMRKRILSDYYRNMYEDEDADQEFFDSIRNVNRDIDEGEKGDEESGVKEIVVSIAEDSSVGKKSSAKGKNNGNGSGKDKNVPKPRNKESKPVSKDVKSTPKDTKLIPKENKSIPKDNKSNLKDTKPAPQDTKNSKPPKSKSDNPYRKNVERNKLNHHRKERFDKKHGLILIVCCIFRGMTRIQTWGSQFHVLTISFDSQFYEQFHCLKKILYLMISLNNLLVATLGPKTTRVGWIGTGVMGGSMCQHLIDAGYQCTVVGADFASCSPSSLTVLLASAMDSLLRELSWSQVLWKLLRILMSFSVLLGMLCFSLLTIAILLM